MFALPFLRRPPPSLAGERVMLRPPVAADHAEWVAVRKRSQNFLAPWEPKWAHDEFDRSAWRQRLRRYREEMDDGTGMPFLIFEKSTGRLAGGITLGNIRHGVAQSGQIGYWMGVDHAGKGYMHEAVLIVIRFGFEALRLHRIEAACIPGNQRSIRVLEKAGFQREGLLRSYLRINGVWQDHLLYALIASDGATGRERG